MYRAAIDPRKLFQERREYICLVRGDNIILRKLLHLRKSQKVLLKRP